MSDIKHQLNWLWRDWEPIAIRSAILPGGDQQLILRLRRKDYEPGCTCFYCRCENAPETAQNGQQGE